MAVEVRNLLPDEAEIDMLVDESQEVVFGNEVVQLHVVEHLLIAVLLA